MLGLLAGAASPIEAPPAHLAIAVDSTPVGTGLSLARFRLADSISSRALRAWDFAARVPIPRTCASEEWPGRRTPPRPVESTWPSFKEKTREHQRY